MGRLRTLKPLVAALPPRIKPEAKVRDDHYGTPEHRAWAIAVKRRAGWRCEVVGCEVRHPARLYADHKIELKDGGAPLDPANGQCLCAAHHSRKTAQARAIRAAARPPEGVGVETPEPAGPRTSMGQTRRFFSDGSEF